MKVPFIHPKLRFTDLLRMLKSINSTWLVYGRYTSKFESVLSEYLGGANVVATSSCTSALQLALHLSKVGPGDEVITTPISWVATSNVIIHSGAKPVFVDIDPKTGLIDEDLIEARITKLTKAVLFVDLFGQMPNLSKIREICDRHKIFMIEDAAHALESERDGNQPGQLSDFAAFSFHSAKNITSGQGGALTTRTNEDASQARILRRDGVINLPDGKRRMVELGFKFDSTDFQSALLIGQLSRIEGKLKKRKRVHDRYLKGIDSKFAQVIPGKNGYKTSNHLTVILVAAEYRDELRKMLLERGIQTSVHYESINLEPYYAKTFGDSIGTFQNAEKFGRAVISLPTYPSLSRREQNYVIKNINQILREKSYK
jgi:dTDP-4-amino-4,6-dideoxygalactose transaminase